MTEGEKEEVLDSCGRRKKVGKQVGSDRGGEGGGIGLLWKKEEGRKTSRE